MIFAASTRFGSGPMCWVNGTPGPLTCGVPVFIRILRIFAGDNGAPFVFAMPWRHATAPVTMGEALEVPEKRWVYQRFSLAPPCASPYPQVVTCQHRRVVMIYRTGIRTAPAAGDADREVHAADAAGQYWQLQR